MSTRPSAASPSNQLEYVLDTETTGLDDRTDRIVELALVELSGYLPTGRTFHRLIDPQVEIPADATRIHGLTNADLAGQPCFPQIAPALLTFIGPTARIIAHNAEFDLGMLNGELAAAGHPTIAATRVHCTLQQARQQWPGTRASLDALLVRLHIDPADFHPDGRRLHSALLDARLLARVYLELHGGRQHALGLTQAVTAAAPIPRKFRSPRRFPSDPAEVDAHDRFLRTLKDPIWLATGPETAA